MHPESFNRLRLPIELHASIRSRSLGRCEASTSGHPLNGSPLLLHAVDLTLLSSIASGNIVLNSFVVLRLIWINGDYPLLLLQLSRPVLFDLDLGNRLLYSIRLRLHRHLMIDRFHYLWRLRVAIYPANVFSSIFGILGYRVTAANAIGQEIVRFDVLF